MKFSNVLMPRWLRPSALTMPMVTVCPTPNGLPIASTTSPTRVCSMRPSVMVGRLVALLAIVLVAEEVAEQRIFCARIGRQRAIFAGKDIDDRRHGLLSGVC